MLLIQHTALGYISWQALYSHVEINDLFSSLIEPLKIHIVILPYSALHTGLFVLVIILMHLKNCFLMHLQPHKSELLYAIENFS